MDLPPLPPIGPKKKTKKPLTKPTKKPRSRKRRKNVKSDAPSAGTSMVDGAEWAKRVAKGRCTKCNKRKADKPFLWCKKCADEV